ncbi:MULTISPECIES: EF-hand domain-containing protein [Oxalobacteraceae]|jgi:Ca2+-binding EF-hand superfamily protein|uniref:EF-hand domain-containing protein n=1 Tax=Oxalobacteraceae TaxID=75682 RepID=UPI0010A3A99A|nr:MULTISPECIES: EF-hand domain-containing protein [Oxalobacteraceae]
MKTSLLLFVLLAVAGSASAQSIVPDLDQSGRKGDMARLAYKQAVGEFDAADTDKDGKLTRDEVAKVAPFKADNFSRYDKNKDGFLSWEEFVGHNKWKKE